MRSFFLLIPLFFASFLQAEPPQLTPARTKNKAKEIFHTHVSHKALTPELARRILKIYLDELDPIKTYFLEEEIATWIAPSDELITQIINDFDKTSFATFHQIYEAFISTIPRRVLIENTLGELPKDVDAKEFKDLTWVKDQNALKERIKRIRGLQIEAALKINDEASQTLTKRITKRRLSRESELTNQSHEAHALALFLKAFSTSLDAHTAYFTPQEAKQFMILVQQRLFGIGAQLRDNLDGLILMDIIEGGPAHRSKTLKVGDKIIAVNGEPIIGFEISEAVELIRGKQGTAVTLTIIRVIEEEEKTFDVRIVRDEVVIKEMRFDKSFEAYGDGVIAVLKLHTFYQDPNSNSADDLRNALREIQDEHKVKGVILDLRSNAGGPLSQAVAVTGMFIKKGIVVSVKDNEGNIHHLRNFDGNIAWDGPLIVLTNKASASASEIVSQTLQDYGRAILVGDPTTYGKGSYQLVSFEGGKHHSVNPEGEYKVTGGLYYTVSGNSPQLKGAQADITVPGFLSEMEIGEANATYPLENDSIEPNFRDTLADVHPFHRGKLLRMYSPNLQERMNHLNALMPTLKANSEKRILENSNYQNFLTEIRKEEMDADKVELFGQNDLQLDEATCIMKEFIHLSQK
ncbi:MAG: hypothetical protein SP1CHLAM54_16140 [Chlamydiia bacterium]|nr:hypothetical protein [Chlamydiia bacterium]MCH9616503.1 hypothetical protein [Chlamydiia bacterium]MCH9629511.1 hypothetical protein [Chlamydiia bacterium]